MAMNANNLRDEIIAAIDASVAADPNGQPTQEKLWGDIATTIVDHITTNAKARIIANTFSAGSSPNVAPVAIDTLVAIE